MPKPCTQQKKTTEKNIIYHTPLGESLSLLISSSLCVLISHVLNIFLKLETIQMKPLLNLTVYKLLLFADVLVLMRFFPQILFFKT